MHIASCINEYANLNEFEKICFSIPFILSSDERGSEVNNGDVRKSMYNLLNKNTTCMD